MPTTPRPVPPPSAETFADAFVVAVFSAQLRREEPGYLDPGDVDRLFDMAARILGTARLYGAEEYAKELYHDVDPG